MKTKTKKTLKGLLLSSLLAMTFCGFAEPAVDVYDVTLRTWMPRVYDNMNSLGYRKYQRQVIVGQMFLKYSESESEEGKLEEVTFGMFTNKTYKISGKPVTYQVSLAEDALSNFSWCGNNKKQEFKTPNMNFSIEMVPSYKIGEEMLDDVHLSIACVKGNGSLVKFECEKVLVAKSLHGYCTGQLGCNCTAWGHISPTRFWGFYGPTSFVTDVASVNGTVTFKWNKKLSRK